MIVEAGKYTPVPKHRGSEAAPTAPGHFATPAGAPAPPGPRLPILPKPAWKDIDRLADATALRTQQEVFDRSGVKIFIPRPSTSMTYGDWVWKGLRDDGWLRAYWRYLRHTSIKRQMAVARRRHGWRQNPKSDVRLLASIPAVEYFHTRKYVDRDFYLDNQNLRNLRRDNPNACVYL